MVNRSTYVVFLLVKFSECETTKMSSQGCMDGSSIYGYFSSSLLASLGAGKWVWLSLQTTDPVSRSQPLWCYYTLSHEAIQWITGTITQRVTTRRSVNISSCVRVQFLVQPDLSSSGIHSMTVVTWSVYFSANLLSGFIDN